MAGIFISYRRADQPGFAGRLADSLIAVFGADAVFRDVDDIHPGDDFVVVLDRQLRQVDVMLVVIGPDWLRANRNGERRLDDGDDFVRREIRAGLASKQPLLPVLVAGTAMPGTTDLPDDLRPLARRQAIVLADASWADDVERLVGQIEPLITTRPMRSTRPGRWWGVAALAVLAIAIVVSQRSGWSPGKALSLDHNAASASRLS
ncbi:MAG: toll/interleukin-1 receptor domain-containing protein [Propionivibrio sp.]